MLSRYMPRQDLWSCRNSVKLTFVVKKGGGGGGVGSFFPFSEIFLGPNGGTTFCLHIVPCLPFYMTLHHNDDGLSKGINGCEFWIQMTLKILCTYSLFLRSNNGLRLNYSSCTSLATLGDRSFLVAAPKLWNDLPCTLRNITSVQNFKKAIKTFLFAKAF